MPARDWCPVCASDGVEEARVLYGRVEHATIVRKGVGPPGSMVGLGSVRLEGGGVVLARLDADVNEGDRVRLVDDDGVVVARTA